MMCISRRQIACLIVAMLSFLLLILLVTKAQGERTLSDYYVAADEWKEICDQRNKSDEPAMTAFSFDGYELFFDDEKKEWYYSLIEGSDHAYDPFVACRENGMDSRVAFGTDKITPEMIREGEDIPVLIYTPDSYFESKIHCSTLPFINVKLDGDSSEMGIELFDNRKEASQRVIRSKADIKVRGGLTQNYPKLGLRISLKLDSVGESVRQNKLSLLGMRQDEDWILYAAYNDQEKIRNVFSSQIWYDSCRTHNVFGVQNGMEYRFVEAFINGNYWGLYAIGYPIDATQLSFAKNRQGQYTEYLFKKKTYEKSEWVPELRHQLPMKGYELKNTTADDVKGWEMLSTYYDALEQAQSVEAVYKLVDVENTIDVYLFLNLIQGIDNWSKNMYTSFKWYEDDYKVLYTPWDMDISWGNRYVEDGAKNFIAPYDFGVEEHKIIIPTSPLGILENLEDPTLDEKICKRYQELRSDKWSVEYLMEMLKGYQADVYDSGAYERDRKRWPDGTYQEGEKGLDTFCQYVQKRLQIMDQYVEETHGYCE